MSASALGADIVPESLRRLSVSLFGCENVGRGGVLASCVTLIMFGREGKGNTEEENDNVNRRYPRKYAYSYFGSGFETHLQCLSYLPQWVIWILA